MSAPWTGYAVFAAGYFCQARVGEALDGLWMTGGDAGKIVRSLVALALDLPIKVVRERGPGGVRGRDGALINPLRGIAQ